MFRFRFKFLADSYLLLFSFFLGMIGAALFFCWRDPVFPSCFWSFSLGMGVIYFTLEKGLWGLPLFLRSLLPQGIFYLMVWYVLSRWSFSTRKRLRLPALAFLMLLTACGAAFEAYLFSF